MKNHCENCRFWKKFKGITGECHCKAPLPYIHNTEDETLHKVTRWPLTKHTQFCGEFQKKE